MERDYQRRYVIAWILGVEILLAIVGSTVVGTGMAVIKEARSLFIKHSLDPTVLAFLMILTLFVICISFVYVEYKQRSRFIAVGVNHLEVEPANRRDGLV